MVALAAGAKLRASTVNGALPLITYTNSDTTVTSSTTLVNATGLSVALEADSLYIWDAFIAFNAGATGDFKAAWTVPAGTAGNWGMWGLSTASTGGVGTMNGARVDGYGTGNTLLAGGNDTAPNALAVRPAGFIDTAGTAGNFQLQFAQNASSATSTVVKFGSWIRAIKVG